MSVATSIAAIFGVIAFAVMFSFVMAWPVMYIINHIFSKDFLNYMFGGEISWVHSWLLSALCTILFKSSDSSSSK